MGPVLQCPASMMSSYGRGDEEKRVCAAADTIKNSSNCVVISVGSNNQWGFEMAIAQSHPHCQIHTLDCFVSHVEVPGHIGAQTTFHPVCIGPEDIVIEGRSFLTWRTFAKSIGLKSLPTVLKMDIEGYEWDVIVDIIRSNYMVPLSISFELHYETARTTLKWEGRDRHALELGAFMDFLYTRGGYVLVDRHDNGECTHCSELVVARLLDGI